MSDSGKAIFPDFGKLVPGFDFLQNLTKQASGAASNGMPKMPKLGSWVAPTLNVEELDRRIQELKAVQFWLDQNATALKATIQALEVQKMTLSALQGMNVNMADMAKAFQMPDASTHMGGMNSGMAAATDLANTMASGMASTMANMSGMAGKASASSDGGKAPHHFAGLEVPETGFMRREHEREQARAEGGAGATADAQRRGIGTAQAEQVKQNDQSDQDRQAHDPAAEAVKAGAGMAAVIDPLQWWGALTQQFQTIANSALQDVAQRKPFEVSQSLAQETMRSARKTASDFAATASKSLVQSANSARDLMTSGLSVGEGWPDKDGSTGTSKRGTSRSASTSRRAAPARVGAVASDDKASRSRGKPSGKTAKTQGARSAKATTSRASKAEGKAETKGSRTASGARSAPQARGSAVTGASGTGSRGGKARTTTATRKVSPRAR